MYNQIGQHAKPRRASATAPLRTGENTAGSCRNQGPGHSALAWCPWAIHIVTFWRGPKKPPCLRIGHFICLVALCWSPDTCRWP